MTSPNYIAKAHHGIGHAEGVKDACTGAPAPGAFDEVFVRIRHAHPEWSRTRVHQRALVEVFKEPR